MIIVATNGCFDVLHVGHVRFLEHARSLGNFLIVGLNGDHSVRMLKGPRRPIFSERERYEMLKALRCVDEVEIFQTTTAEEFLWTCAPDIWVKGGDWTLKTLDAGERKAVEDCGGKIVIIPKQDGWSTTKVLDRL